MKCDYRCLLVCFWAGLSLLLFGCSRGLPKWIDEARAASENGLTAEAVTLLSNEVQRGETLSAEASEAAFDLARECWQPELAAAIFERAVAAGAEPTRQWLGDAIETYQFLGDATQAGEWIEAPVFRDLPRADRAWLEGRQALLRNDAPECTRRLLVLRELAPQDPRTALLEAMLSMRSDDPFAVLRAALVFTEVARLPREPLAAEAVRWASLLPAPMLTTEVRHDFVEQLQAVGVASESLRRSLWRLWYQLDHDISASDLAACGPRSATEAVEVARILQVQGAFDLIPPLLAQWKSDEEAVRRASVTLQVEVALQQSKLEEAQRLIDATEAIDPGTETLWRAWIASERGAFAQTASLVADMAGLDLPSSEWERLRNLARRLQRAGQAPLAADLYLQFAQRLHASGQGRVRDFLEGISTALEVGRDGEGLELLRYALEVEPENADLINSVAYLEMLLDEPPTVSLENQKSLLSGPGAKPGYQSTWALHLIREGRLAEAQEILSKIDPSAVPSAPLLEAWALHRMGREIPARSLVAGLDSSKLLATERALLDSLRL